MTTEHDRGTIPTDHTGLRVLTFDECLLRLAECPVGRFAFLNDGEIDVLPVNHTVDGLNIYFRTRGGSKIEAAVNSDRVSFEADSYDERAMDGWSVLVYGTAEIVEPRDILRLEPIARDSWVPPDSSEMTWVRIRSAAITGRALRGDEAPGALSTPSSGRTFEI
jgi:hypothetical protein